MCTLCPFKTIQKSHLERHMTFHDKSNFNPKKGYYTCEYCNYYSTNTGKMKQHEVIHTQEWEALIEEVATADIYIDNENNNDKDFDNSDEINMIEKNKESNKKDGDVTQNANINKTDSNDDKNNEKNSGINNNNDNDINWISTNDNNKKVNENDNENIIKMVEQQSTQPQNFIF